MASTASDYLPFLMQISEVQHHADSTATITGYVLQGSARTNDTIEIVGQHTDTISRKILSCQTLDEQVDDEVLAGQQTKLTIEAADEDRVNPWTVLATPGSIGPHTKFLAELTLFPVEEGGRKKSLFSGLKPIFMIYGSNYVCEIRLNSDNEFINPGETAVVQITMMLPLAVRVGSQFEIRELRKFGRGTVLRLLD